jgi:hypothetical protein
MADERTEVGKASVDSTSRMFQPAMLNALNRDDSVMMEATSDAPANPKAAPQDIVMKAVMRRWCKVHTSREEEEGRDRQANT